MLEMKLNISPKIYIFLLLTIIIFQRTHLWIVFDNFWDIKQYQNNSWIEFLNVLFNIYLFKKHVCLVLRNCFAWKVIEYFLPLKDI